MTYRFGPYELNAQTGELRKSGVRVRLGGQPIEVLTLLVQRAGDLVTRDQLKEALWKEDTFTDFDHGVNTAVQRIRRALDDSATEPKFIETLPRKGYRFVAGVDTTPQAHAPHQPPKWAYGAGAACLLVAIALFWPDSKYDYNSNSVSRVARQLTSDIGLTAWPDITPDGQLVAYASDRDGGPDTDIWLHHIETDESTQLTDEPGDEIQPRFSPDGTRIVYHSQRDSGLYVVSTLGGTPERFAPEGRNPKFSPDGNRLAYTIGRQGVGSAANLVLANADGSAAEVINYGMRFLGVGVAWLPDGRLITGGNRTADLAKGDWFVLTADGASIEPAEVASGDDLAVSRPPPFAPIDWLEPEQAVLFSARQGDSIDLWLQPFSLERGKVTGPPTKLTSGGAIEFDAGVSADGRIVYSSQEQNIDLWRLPLAPDRMSAEGPPVRLTTAPGAEYAPTLSADGTEVGYLVSPSSSNPFRARLHFGQVEPFEAARLGDQGGVGRRFGLGDNGSEVVYSVGSTVYSASTTEGVPRKVCSDCGQLLTWFEPEQLILHRGEHGNQIVAFDTKSGKHAVLAEHERYVFQEAKVSPDGAQLLFHVLTSGATFRQVFVAPMNLEKTCSYGDWIAITRLEDISFRAEWSPDGRLIYYFSNQGGPYGIWAQRMDAGAGRPVGEPALVYQGSPGQPAFVSHVISGTGLPKMAVGPDFILFDASERRGNVWLLEPTGDQP